MEDLAYGIAGGIAALAFLAGLIKVAVDSAASFRAIKAAAAAAGLTRIEVKALLGFRRQVAGRVGSLVVRLRRYARANNGTRIAIGGLGHRLGELSFRRMSDAAAAYPSGAPEIVLGDRAFDAVVHLSGSAELACAVFDAETRAIVAGLLRSPCPSSSVTLADGILRADVPDHERLILPELIAAAQRLVRPADLGARLAENALRDPSAGARLSSLRALCERHAHHAGAKEPLRAALTDRSPEVRLRAALALGAEGHPTLLTIAWEDMNDQRAARAMAGLGDQLSSARLQAIGERSLRVGRMAVAEVCIESLGQRGGPEALAFLQGVLTAEKRALGAAAARALAAGAGALAEPALIQSLADGPPEVLVAVAEALGQVGSGAAVMPLRAAEERVQDARLQRAARRAIADIQSRQPGDSPGQLSLAAHEGGQLSVVDDASGQLSLPRRHPP